MLIGRGKVYYDDFIVHKTVFPLSGVHKMMIFKLFVFYFFTCFFFLLYNNNMGGILHTVAYGATGLAFAFVILSLGNI